MKSSVINCGAAVESGGHQVRTGHFSLVRFPLRCLGTLSRLRLAQPQGLGTSSPGSALESEQACESTR